jgi:hypothetical protein
MIVVGRVSCVLTVLGGDCDEMVAVKIITRDKIDGECCGYLSDVSGGWDAGTGGSKVTGNS